MQSGEAALYVKITNLMETKNVFIPIRGAVHAAAMNIMGQMVDAGEPGAERGRIALSRPAKVDVPDRTFSA